MNVALKFMYFSKLWKESFKAHEFREKWMFDGVLYSIFMYSLYVFGTACSLVTVKSVLEMNRRNYSERDSCNSLKYNKNNLNLFFFVKINK